MPRLLPAPMNRPEQEGVIKFDLGFKQKPLPKELELAELIAWRALCHRLQLIGQNPVRYGGLGFGNISRKIDSSFLPENRFGGMLISGTQTGAAEYLNAEHFCLVTSYSVEQNRIVAEGPVKPSSEALTHAAVYRANDRIRFVIHGHCPEIWQATQKLAIPSIARSIAYGTPEMADAVGELIAADRGRSAGLFSMLGHEDGIISYGNCADDAATLLVATLARAIAAPRGRDSENS